MIVLENTFGDWTGAIIQRSSASVTSCSRSARAPETHLIHHQYLFFGGRFDRSILRTFAKLIPRLLHPSRASEAKQRLVSFPLALAPKTLEISALSRANLLLLRSFDPDTPPPPPPAGGEPEMRPNVITEVRISPGSPPPKFPVPARFYPRPISGSGRR